MAANLSDPTATIRESLTLVESINVAWLEAQDADGDAVAHEVTEALARLFEQEPRARVEAAALVLILAGDLHAEVDGLVQRLHGVDLDTHLARWLPK